MPRMPASLIAALGLRTTYPPQVMMQFTQTANLTITPQTSQVLRDTTVQSHG